MSDSNRNRVRAAILDLFDQGEEPEPPRRITIAPSADLYKRIALLAHKLGQSWNATACLLLDASVVEALDVVDNDLQLKVTQFGKGMTPEQLEDFQGLERDQQDEIMQAFSEWTQQPASEREHFTHPLLRDAQLRDEQARQALGKGSNL